MIKVLFLGIFLLAFPFSTTASLEGEFDSYLNDLGNIDELLTKRPECREVLSTLPSCGAISDSFCNTLWNPKNQGNLSLADGEILSGRSPKSDRSHALTEYYKAVADSLERLPPDLKQKAAPHLMNLQNLLKNENDSDEWIRAVEDSLNRFDYAFTDTVNERAKKQIPEVMAKKFRDRTPEDMLKYDDIRYSLSDESVEARYKESKNWKRVESVFTSIRQDLLDEVASLNISSKQKKQMMDKLSTVKLSLPTVNPAKGASRSSCNSTEVNANYLGSHNRVTVCAGFFNTHQSESALYYILAHELGHAVDSGSQCEDQHEREGKIAQKLKPLIGANGKGYSCDEWAKALAEMEPKEIPNLRAKDPFDKLDGCMVSRDRLIPWDQEKLIDAAQKRANALVTGYADDGDFLKLSEPSYLKEGKKVENPFYLNPTFLTAHYRGSLKSERVTDYPTASDIFTQSLRCSFHQEGEKKKFYEEIADKETRARLVEESIGATLYVLSKNSGEYFSHCGQSCDALVKERLAASSGEQFADWFATKAFKRHLARVKSPRLRREASAASVSLFCNPPSLETQFPDTVLVERKYSYKVHPDDRSRRHFVYSPENSKLLGCEASDIAKRFSVCEP